MKANDVCFPLFMVVSNFIAALVTTKAVTYAFANVLRQEQKSNKSSPWLRNLQQECCACSTSTDPLELSLFLREAVTVEGIMKHLNAFQDFADQFDGNRGTGTPGYTLSAGYVTLSLEEVGYEITIQGEEVEQFVDLGDSELVVQDTGGKVYNYYDDFYSIENSPFGTANALVQNMAGGGCQSLPFGGFKRGNIAVINGAIGTCSASDRVRNAQRAGASGAIVHGVFPFLEEGLRIPVLETSDFIAQELVGKTVFMFSNTGVEIITQNLNVLAELPTRDGEDDSNDEVVMVGAHLDSISWGPGIEDDGSGSAAILEIAIQLAKLGVRTKKRIRFGWWDAEELGLLGSSYYISNLGSTETSKISAYLNFDMIASPNFVRVVYAPNFAREEPIAQVFVDYFASQELPIMPLDSPIALSAQGRTDHTSFQNVGIPSTGLFTGANTRKTEEWAEIFGGTAGIDLDPCYHQSCDTIENINQQSLDEMSDAICHGILTIANMEPSSDGKL